MENKKVNFKDQGSIAGLSFSLSVFFFVLTLVVGGIVLSLCADENSVVYTALSYVFSPLALIVVVLLCARFTGEKVLPCVGVKKCHIKYYLSGILLAGGMLLGLGFVNTYFAQLLAGWGISIGGATLPLDSVWHYLLFVLVSAILPAVTEECLFRGVVLKNARGMGMLACVLLNGLIFSLYHWSLSQLVYQFIYGVALAFLAYKAGSVIPSIIAHFINNFAIITLTYFKVNLDLFSPVVIAIGVALLMGFVLLTLLPIKKGENNENLVNKKGERKSFLITSSLGVLICVLYIVINSVVKV